MSTLASSSTSWRRWRARHLVGGLGIALLLLVLVSEGLGWRYLRVPLQHIASSRLGVPVRLEAPFRLYLLRPPELSLGALWMAAAPQSGAPFLADGHDLKIGWRWRDLWALRDGAPLRLRTLEASHLEVHARRDSVGQASWQFTPKSSNDSTAAPQYPQFERLRVDRGAVHVDDVPLALVLEVRFDINEALTTPESVGRTGGFTVTARGTHRQQPVEARLRAPHVLPFVAEGGAPPIQVQAQVSSSNAHFSYEGTLTDLLGQRHLDGTFSADGPSLGAMGKPIGVTLPSTPPFALKGRLTKTDPVWHVGVSSASIGSSRLAGEFHYDPQPAVPKLTGTLRGQRLAMTDLAPAVGAPTASNQAKITKAKGRVLPDKHFDLPTLKVMDADVHVALDELDLATPALDPLRPLKGHILLENGVLRIEELDARTAGGSVAGSTQLDSRESPPKFSVDLSWRGIDLAGWLKGVRKEDATVKSTSAPTKLKTTRTAARTGKAPVTAYLTGELRGNAKLNGQGNSTAAILSTLEGQAQAVVRDGTLSHLVIEAMGIDIAQGLGVLIRGDQSLPLNCAALGVHVKQGVATPQVAVVDTSVTTVNIDGNVDLAQERLNLRALVKPKNFSFAALRSPLHISGPFAAPKVRPEGLPIAAKLGASVALALVNPVAAILPLLDPGDDAGNGCRALAASGRTD